MGRRRQRQDRRPAHAAFRRSSRATRADTTPGTRSTSAAQKFVLRLIPSGILHPGVTCVIGNGVVVDPQALFAEIDELARLRHRRRRPPVRQRQGAPDPAVSPRPRPAGGGAPRRAQDRHDVARHRPGLRGQDRRAAASGSAISATARRSSRRSARTSTRATASSRTRRWTGSRCSTQLVELRRADAAVDRGTCRCALAQRHAPRAVRCCSRARRARCSTSTTAPIRSSPRRTRRSAACAPASASGRAPIDGVMGVVKAYTTRVGEGPLPTELRGRHGQPPARERQRVRRGHRPAAPLRLVRRGGRALRGADQRARRARADQARRARRARGDPDLHRLPARRRDADRISRRPGRAGPVRAGLRDACRAGAVRRAGVTRFEDLPHEARRYVERLEEVSGVPVAVVSTGSGRADTIVREASLAASWVGQEAGGPGR